MSDAWAVVAAALGSASLTIAGTFGLDTLRGRRARREAHNDRLRNACVQMGSHALAFALRAQTLYLTAVFRSGIGEGLDVVLYHRKPLDPMDLAEWLSADLRPMLEAQSLIEVAADEELVRSAADLVLAAMTVLEKASNVVPDAAGPVRSPRQRLARRLRALVPLRRDPEVEKATQQAVRGLGQQLRQFARLTRDRLGVNDPDVVIRAFPELFAEADRVDGEPPQPSPGTPAARSGAAVPS